MLNEQGEVIESFEEPIEEIVETKDEYDNDTTDWKAIALKNQGIAKRYKTKLSKSKEVKEPEPVKEVSKAKEEFDYAEKAYLKASGVQNNEFPMVLEAISTTGKTLEQVLDSKYFQAELKETRELEATKNAIPDGTKRSSASAKDSVEYWIAKGELPPADQRELRTKVVNARISSEKDKSTFSDNPVV